MRHSRKPPGKPCVTQTIDSPVGRLKLAASDDGLAAILWENDNPRRVQVNIVAAADDHPVLIETKRQLDDYFAGVRTRFDLPLDIRGTKFQIAVWRALCAIPFGETRSYGAIAAALGRPKAGRAVGAANGRNPLSIVVPCHRLVGATGSLTGFAGSLETKAELLRLERRQGEMPP